MTSADEQQRQRFKDVLRKDAQDTKSQVGERIRDTFARPVNLLFMAIGAILLFGINYAAEKTIDAMLDNEEPQVVQLDTDLKSASVELRQSADEIRTMVSQIDLGALSEDQLREQFESLQNRLSGLTDIVQKASAQTDKVAAISEALREDWKRNRRIADGRVDGIPDLVLGSGEAVSVCSGLASVGVIRMTQEDGTAHIKANDWTYWVNPGQRVPLEGGATLGFIGLKDGMVQMKVNCPS